MSKWGDFILWRAAIASLSVWAVSSASAVTLPQPAWTQTLFSANNCGYVSAVHSAGDTYVTGEADGVIFGTNTNGVLTGFLAKLGPSGNLLWANLTGAASFTTRGLAVDASGNAYVTDGQLQKYNSNGSLLWSTASTLNAHEVALDNSGNIFVASFTNSQAYVSKLNSSGQVLWTRAPESAPSSGAFAIAVDASGDVVIGGQNTYSISPYEVNGFAAKYDPQGNLLWNPQLGPTTGNISAYGVAVDSSGDIFISGVGGSVFGESTSGGGGFLIKYSASGSEQWINRYGEENATPIAVDPTGAVYVGAGYQLLKYNPSGNLLWQSSVVSPSAGENSVSWANGNLYIAAVTSGSNGYSYAGIESKVICDNYWNVDANGNWSNASNWSGATPNAIGAAANFYNSLTAPRTITVDAPVAIGTMTFLGSNQYTISGSNAITMQASTGSAAITDLGGNHLVSAPLVLASGAIVSVANLGDTLTLSGPISGNGALNMVGTGADPLRQQFLSRQYDRQRRNASDRQRHERRVFGQPEHHDEQQRHGGVQSRRHVPGGLRRHDQRQRAVCEGGKRLADPQRRRQLHRPDDDLRRHVGARRRQRPRLQPADDDSLDRRPRRRARLGRERPDRGQPERLGGGDHRQQSRLRGDVHRDADGESGVRRDDVRGEHRRLDAGGSPRQGRVDAFRQREIDPRRLEQLQRRDDRQRRHAEGRQCRRLGHGLRPVDRGRGGDALRLRHHRRAVGNRRRTGAGRQRGNPHRQQSGRLRAGLRLQRRSGRHNGRQRRTTS